MRHLPFWALSLLPLIGIPSQARATTWALSTIDPTSQTGNTASLRLDSAGRPRLAYWAPSVGVRRSNDKSDEVSREEGACQEPSI